VLLKGSTTLVADPDGRTRINPTGTRWLGTAGTGDVLSGVCGSLLATGCSALDAGSGGAFLHGLAARLVSADRVPIAATDLLDAWPDVLRAVLAGEPGPETLDA
jgi:NAD(P)H-hydrate repair Nnr-like enzyme with NAD(P)H-hydrate dehydratase domain